MVERGAGLGEGWVAPDGVPVLDKIEFGVEWRYNWELHRYVKMPAGDWWSWQNPGGRR